MLQNFLSVAILITIAWAVLIGGYMLLSRQQTLLEQELKELQQMLDRQQSQEGKEEQV